MFISEKIVFIELHKTGSTHIVKLLSNLLEGQQVGKHDPATPDLLASQRIFLGSIRSPWEWYVSLWAYGCDRQGAVYKAVTRRRGSIRRRNWRKSPLQATQSLIHDFTRSPDRWQRTYADVSDASGFREWLYRMHDKRYWQDLGNDYYAHAMSDFAGLLTYRYLRLFCRGDFKDVLSLEDLQTFEKRHCYIDYFIRNEHLEDDLIKALAVSGIILSQAQKEALYAADKTNISSKKEPISYYYDQDTIALINRRERLIIDKFGYSPPVI